MKKIKLFLALFLSVYVTSAQVSYDAPADICVNEGVQTDLAGGTATGGVYSGAGVTDHGNGSTYSFDPAAAGVGVHTLTYTLANSIISQLGADIDGAGVGDFSGSSLSISSDGSRIAIGSPYKDGNVRDSGHVRIYQYSATGWVQLGRDIDGEAEGDLSGLSVSLSSDGTRIAIGAPNNVGNGRDSGHVRIYEYRNDGWFQLGGDIDGEVEGDLSGSSVSLSSDGTRIAIGAPNNDGNRADSGHVRIYEYSGTDWIQLGR
jgi:WD40 repeat protein